MNRWLPLLVLPGCVVDQYRYEERQREICDPVVGCAERSWWPDTDLDGWGDGEAAAVFAVDPPADHVSNRADCDDTDAANTGDLGLCPRAFGEVEELRLGTDGGAEWVAVRLTEPVYLHEAEDRCAGWGGPLGAPPEAAVGMSPIWVAAELPIPPDWSDVARAETLTDTPLVWTGSVLRNATVDEQANVACRRDPADPLDYVSYAEPPP